VRNFVTIAQIISELSRFNDFQHCGRPPSWIFIGLFDHPQTIFGSLCYCTKCGYNLCSSFDYMQVLIFCALLENTYSRPQNGVLGFILTYELDIQ